MSDIAESKGPEKSSILVDEIVELRQLKSERNTLIKTSEYYKERASQLEIELSELKAKVMAKDYEISLLTTKKPKLESPPKHSSLLLSNYFSPNKPKGHSDTETSIDSSALQEENALLRIKLEQEKHCNLLFEKQLQEISQNYFLSEEFRKQHAFEEKVCQLEQAVLLLTEENQILKAKVSSKDNIDLSTGNKSESDLKISTIEVESSDSFSFAESTPRPEGVVPALNATIPLLSFFPNNSKKSHLKTANPQPPQTRSTSECPKKASISTRPIKYVKCSIQEIMATPTKSRQLAEFCPSSLRKAKNQ